MFTWEQLYLSTGIFGNMVYNPLIYASITTITMVILWSITKQRIYADKGVFFYAHFRRQAIQHFTRVFHIPSTHVELFTKQNHVESLYNKELLLPQYYNVRARPFVGDHIHMAISFYIDGIPRKVEHDRDPIQQEPYEQKSQLCQVPGTTAYTKMWPHAGVHTHCDGLIHVHPWSAPRVLRRQGIDITLGLWFDQAGIQYHEYPLQLIFSDGVSRTSNETHTWRIAERECFKGPITNIYEQQFDHIWLGHAYASYVVWFGPRDSSPPPDLQDNIHSLTQVGAYGYDQQSYPHQCVFTK